VAEAEEAAVDEEDELCVDPDVGMAKEEVEVAVDGAVGGVLGCDDDGVGRTTF
jgi:hypothetical protein